MKQFKFYDNIAMNCSSFRTVERDLSIKKHAPAKKIISIVKNSTTGSHSTIIISFIAKATVSISLFHATVNKHYLHGWFQTKFYAVAENNLDNSPTFVTYESWKLYIQKFRNFYLWSSSIVKMCRVTPPFPVWSLITMHYY